MAARASTVLTLILAFAAVSACDDTRTCRDVGCGPTATYSMHIESPEPELELGVWRVDLQIDGGTTSAECTIDGSHAGPGNLICEVGPWTSEPSHPLELSVSVGTRITEQGSGEPTDTGDPPEYSNEGIFVSAFFGDQESPLQTIDVAVFYEDALVIEAQRSPTFEVQEDFGGPGCGSCLRPVEDVVALPQGV